MNYECLKIRNSAVGDLNQFVASSFGRASLAADNTYPSIKIQESSHDHLFLNCTARTWGTPQHKYGFEVASGCQRNAFLGGKYRGATDDWLDSGTGTVIDIVHSVNGRQNLNNSKLQVLNDLIVPRVSQTVQPTPAVGAQVYWHDSVNAKLYLVFNDPILGVRKVELPA